MVQTQNERADFFVAPVAVGLNHVLDGAGKFIFAFVMRGELFIERFVGELTGFAFVEDRELRIKTEFVKMFAHELETETVERADVRDVKERKLARPMFVVGMGVGFFFEFTAQAQAHFGGGGFGESDDEQFIERRAVAVETIETAGNECFGFARAGTGHDEHVAARQHGALLRRRQRINCGGRRGFHVREILATDGRR